LTELFATIMMLAK